jgi:hypothetical protein
MWVVAHDIEKHEDRVMYRVEREAPLGSLLAETQKQRQWDLRKFYPYDRRCGDEADCKVARRPWCEQTCAGKDESASQGEKKEN